MPGSVVGAARLVRRVLCFVGMVEIVVCTSRKQIPRFARDDKFVAKVALRVKRDG